MVKFSGKNKKTSPGDVTEINVFKRNPCNIDGFESKYKELFEHMQNCVAVYMAVDNGEDFIITDFNRSAEITEKVKKADIIGERVTWVFPSVKDIGLLDVFRRVYKTGKAEHHTVSFYNDGRISGWKENCVYKIPSGEIVAVYNDVTSRVMALEELKLAKGMLVLAQKSAGAGMWDWDMESGKLNCSDELYDLFGLDPGKDKADFDTWFSVLHPQDRQSAEDIINRSVRDHIPLYNEYRIILPSGEVRWINAYGGSTYDNQGKAVRMSGICIDITSQKKSSEALHASESQYHDLFDNMLEGYAYCRMLYDKDKRPCDWIYLDVNQRFEELASLKDVVGKKVTEIIPGIRDTNPELFEIYDRVATTGNPESFENYIGQLSIWLHISVFSPQKEHFIAVFHNITEVQDSRKKINTSLEKLQTTLVNTINALSSIVELKEPYTSGHQVGVKKLSMAIAEEMGLKEDKVKAISHAAILHDLGKIMVPASILSKPSSLSPLELAMIKTHSQAGHDIIKEIDFGYPVEEIVLQHHERLDGSGYPNGLKENEIMLEAKIIAVADVVEAMASHRPYRPALGITKALEAIKAGSGILYDSKVVDACISVVRLKKFKF